MKAVALLCFLNVDVLFCVVLHLFWPPMTMNCIILKNRIHSCRILVEVSYKTLRGKFEYYVFRQTPRLDSNIQLDCFHMEKSMFSLIPNYFGSARLLPLTA